MSYEYQVNTISYCQLMKIYKNENINLTIHDEETLHFEISYWKDDEFHYFYRHFFNTNDFLNFDWSNETVHSNKFHNKSIPKDVEYFMILSDGKVTYSQIPSREEVSSQGKT